VFKGGADGSSVGKVYQVWETSTPPPPDQGIETDYLAYQNTMQSQAIVNLGTATTTIPYGNINNWYVNYDVSETTNSISSSTPGIVQVRVGRNPTDLYVLNTAYVYEQSTNNYAYGKVLSNWNTYAEGTWYVQSFIYDHATSTAVGELLASSTVRVFIVEAQDVYDDPNQQGVDCSIYTDSLTERLQCILTNTLTAISNYLLIPGETSQAFFNDTLALWKTVFPFNIWFDLKDTVIASVDSAAESDQELNFVMSYPGGATSTIPLFTNSVIADATNTTIRNLWYNAVLLLVIAMMSWTILRSIYHYFRQ